HWYRPDFDEHLVREAQAAGAIYLDETSLNRVDFPGGRVSLEGTRRGESVRIDAGFLVDASGPRGLMARTLNLGAPLRWLPPTEAVYTHFEGVERFEDVGRPFQGRRPYPPDAAALHHVFPDGWIWVLRFNNGITSAGAATTNIGGGTLAGGVLQADRAWNDLLDSLPSVRDQFAGARAVEPWFHSPQLAFRTSRVVGPNWALLPSAAGVIDPLLSTGFPLTLLGIHRLLEIFASEPSDTTLREYERVTLAELDATEMLVAALYNSMSDPALFKRLTLLYFAAASFSEAARRLHRPELAPGFLLHAHPVFGPALHVCCAIALASPQGRARDELMKEIDAAIEPFDIAGLLDRSRHDWYPALADDLIANASKLQATPAQVDALLERCGFTSTRP